MPDTAAFARQLEHFGTALETSLDALLQPAPLPGEIMRPATLLAAIRHGALGGGKRLRPFLLVEAAALFGVPKDGAMRAACALEMVHCYSLVHDDLPAMDDDDVRRGRPTVHKAFGEATAILAGDSLLTLAFDVLAGAATHPSGEIRAALVLGLARASGLGGMAGGQALDLAAEASAVPLAPDAIRELQAMKTGALLRFAVEAGAILGDAGPAARAALADYGAHLGAAFQIADDLLDAEGDSATLGKRAGKDADRNKATLVQALGVEAARALCGSHVAAACAALDAGGFGDRAAVLRQAAHFTASREL